MFLKDDIYTSSGALKLYHCWTDKVTKFDSSSFYNWEQDNLPVYDLEERTFYLWEKLGYPTSSIPGVALVVSADASDTDVQCNKNVFRTVSAAIDALPQTINFPVIIEVANFGQLGDLVLDNYKFGPRGSLEIINRNFSKVDPAVSALINVGGVTALNDYLGIIEINQDSNSQNSYYYGSSIQVNSTVETILKNSKLFSPKGQFIESSCLSISSTVLSSTTDTRLTSNLNGFIATNLVNASLNNSVFTKSNLILDSKTISPHNATSSVLNFKTYDLNSDSFDLINSYDVSTFDEYTNSYVYRNDNPSPNLNLGKGVFFGNKLNKIVVTNCDGPIYIRNFFLDGSGANKTTNYYGVEISDSNNIYLENIVTTRYRKAGLYVNNSNVKLLRGFVATRIYDFDSSNRRLTNSWNTRRKSITFNFTSGYLYDDIGAGILANNSVIQVSSTRAIEETLQTTRVLDLYKLGGAAAPNYIQAYYPYINQGYIFECSKNANGIILNNSLLIGGDIQNTNNVNHYRYNINFNVYGNVGYGVKSLNSKLSLDARLNVFENLKGISLDSSVFEIDKLSIIYNQKVGLEAYNSNIVYNKNLVAYQIAGGNLETHRQVYFYQNGQNIILNSSKMAPVFTSGMHLIYDRLHIENAIAGKGSDGTKRVLPSVEVTNNSELILVQPYLYRDLAHSNDSGYSVKGSELLVKDNSKARLIGGKYFATKVVGPIGRTYQANMAAVYAGNNSTIEINGPTVIYQYGIDLLAENSSKININPHKSNFDGIIDVSSFNLDDPRNHTAVELQSTRSCIVVDNHSELNIKDLGSYKQCWTRSGQYNTLANSGLDYSSTVGTYETYVSAGSLQFYPNPIGSYGASFPGNNSVTPAAGSYYFDTNTNPGLYYLKNESTTTDPFTYSAVTTGGYCVRALNNSIVNVHNVNFPCGWWQTSAPYYDNNVGIDSGGFCYKTFIWNIADNSQLKASYLSVSGLYPRSAGYYGPYGVWTSGSPAKPASGLPIGTPDTSSTSVLDYFGVAPTSANPFGKSTAENYGPFRLYFSVDPVSYAMYDLNATGTYGVLPQIYSQGYQPSGNMGCTSYVSSIYGSIWNKTSTNAITTSGYYYGSAMMSNSIFGKVMLDESAAETFANAKHCAVGKSGNVKLVSIHYPYTSFPGSSYGLRGIKSVNLFDIERDN